MKQWKWRIHWMSRDTNESGTFDPLHTFYSAAMYERDRLNKQDSGDRIVWFQPEFVEAPTPPGKVASLAEVESLIAGLRVEVDSAVKMLDEKIAAAIKPQLFRVWWQHKDFPTDRRKSAFVGSHSEAREDVRRGELEYPNLVHWIEPEVSE